MEIPTRAVSLPSAPLGCGGRGEGVQTRATMQQKSNITWIAIFLMIAAMAMYVLSDDESRPQPVPLSLPRTFSIFRAAQQV